jgi:hypothetical protein
VALIDEKLVFLLVLRNMRFIYSTDLQMKTPPYICGGYRMPSYRMCPSSAWCRWQCAGSRLVCRRYSRCADDETDEPHLRCATTRRVLECKLGDNDFLVGKTGMCIVDMRLELSEALAVPMLQRMSKLSQKPWAQSLTMLM